MEILMEPNYWGGNFCLDGVGGGAEARTRSVTLGEDMVAFELSSGFKG